ncbi:MAG: restriction endonuclease subunit S [Acidiferrobacteraceae bacterium]|nr:restriction endonuclease subunit S [Acidiferrobacteraceae bacterium]
MGALIDRPLNDSQVREFETQGFTLLSNALDAQTLEKLNRDLNEWLLESRNYSDSYGQQTDGRPRFSLEPGHTFERPALRRVASPVELSLIYLNVMRDSAAVDAVAQLIGPNIKFNNAKINLKHPGMATKVDFHQDFMFEPHTNDDLVTVLYFLDELTPDNGPLEIVPSSHKGPLYDHWHDGIFTGAVSPEVAVRAQAKAISCFGLAGTACLMSTRLLHGSAPNRSSAPRTLYIVEYCAEDAYPLQANHIPSKFAGEIVRGESTNRVRCSDYDMIFPEFPTGASFFEQQARRT